MTVGRVGRALGLAGLGLILLATLTPTRDIRGASQATPLLCLVCGDNGTADVANNLLLFLPLAIGLRFSGASWLHTVVASALLSFTVELLQLLVIPGRDASLSDLLTNSASAAVGATIGPAVPGMVAPAPRRAAVLLLGGSAAVVVLLAGWAWLMMPQAPIGALGSRWAHESRGPGAFHGQVRSVMLDGVPMPRHGPPPDADALRRRLDQGTMTLEVELVSGAPVVYDAWIYMLQSRVGGAIELFQLRTEAGVTVPTRGHNLRLGAPAVTLADAFPKAPGVPVRLRATARAGQLRLSSSYGGAERAVELGISPAYGWIMFLPFEVAAGQGVRWITASILGLLMLPLGYWAAWIRRPLAAGGALALALVSALAVLPAATGFPAVHWSEWLAGVLGAAAGWAMQRSANYLQARCASPSDNESSSS